jgi:hypothetical protein
MASWESRGTISLVSCNRFSASSGIVTVSPTRAGQGSGPALAHRVGSQGDDWNRGRSLHRGGAGFRPEREDDIDTESDQIGREARHPVVVPLGVSPLDDHIAPLDVAKVTQPARKAVPGHRTRCHDEDTNARHLPSRLLRLAGQRYGEEAEGDSADERAALHYSMT